MLNLIGVSKTYPGGVQALQDIRLSVPRGMFGLLGPNGAGKSTLMRTLATLQPPDSGTITFDDINILQDKTALRRRLGYLPQEFGAYPRTSALMMLRYLAALKGISGPQQRQQVEELLVKTNLWDARHQSVEQLSGGMKQRYGIAQALLGQPALLIVDEPTAGLDPAERRRFLNILAEVGAETVVILSTHIVEDVKELCQQVALMGRGRILKVGAPLQLLQELRGRLWTQAVPRAAVGEIRARYTVLSTRLKAGVTELRVLSEVPPAGMHPAAPELEDVYFSTLLAHGLKDNLE